MKRHLTQDAPVESFLNLSMKPRFRSRTIHSPSTDTSTCDKSYHMISSTVCPRLLVARKDLLLIAAPCGLQRTANCISSKFKRHAAMPMGGLVTLSTVSCFIMAGFGFCCCSICCSMGSDLMVGTPGSCALIA
jgi:hypothetical protein